MFADSGQPLAFILPPENSMSTAHFSDSTEKAMKIRATFFLFQTHSPNGNELRIFNCLGFGSLFFFLFLFYLLPLQGGQVGGSGRCGVVGGAGEGHLPFVSSDSALLLALCRMPPMLFCCLFWFAYSFGQENFDFPWFDPRICINLPRHYYSFSCPPKCFIFGFQTLYTFVCRACWVFHLNFLAHLMLKIFALHSLWLFLKIFMHTHFGHSKKKSCFNKNIAIYLNGFNRYCSWLLLSAFSYLLNHIYSAACGWFSRMLLLLRPKKTAFSALHLLLFGQLFCCRFLFAFLFFLVPLHLLLFRLFSASLLIWQFFVFFFFFVDEKNPLVRKARDKWCAAAALSLDFHTQIGNSPQTFEFYYFPDAAASLLFISFRWPNAEKFRFSNF